MIRSYGVSTEGDGSKVLAESLDAIAKRHPQYTSQQIAAQFGISPDEVDHWIRYRKEIAQFDKQYMDLHTHIRRDGGGNARASTAISRAMGEWSGVIEVLRDKMVSLFLPAVEAVAKGLSELLSYVTSEENVAAFAAYFDKPIAAVKELARLLKVLYDHSSCCSSTCATARLGRSSGRSIQALSATGSSTPSCRGRRPRPTPKVTRQPEAVSPASFSAGGTRSSVPSAGVPLRTPVAAGSGRAAGSRRCEGELQLLDQ